MKYTPDTPDRPDLPANSPTQAEHKLGEPASQDLLLIDFTQGVTTGSCFYLAALVALVSLTPPSVVVMVALALSWFFWGCYRMAWREAALALGITVGLSANLFAPVLLFLLYLVAWLRERRALTTPWVAIGLALFTVGAGIAQPTVEGQLGGPQRAVLYLYYLAPLAIGALGCAVTSQVAVAVARLRSIEVSLEYLGPQWLSLTAVLLSLLGVLLMALHLPRPL